MQILKGREKASSGQLPGTASKNTTVFKPEDRGIDSPSSLRNPKSEFVSSVSLIFHIQVTPAASTIREAPRFSRWRIQFNLKRLLEGTSGDDSFQR